MPELTSYERMARMYAHKDADRVPITDSPWGSTIQRWRREGLPEGTSFHEYFNIDHIAAFGVDNSPRYEKKLIEQTDEYTIETTSWGTTLKHWRNKGGVPEFLNFTIVDRESWADAKARMVPTPDRINWKQLENNYAKWREKGAWIRAGLWFGFDVTHSWMVGTERVLMAMVEDPEWLVDMWNHQLSTDLALLDQVWEAGYHFDEIHWPDDMGYKGTQFFSVNMYRELLKPVHKRAADWAHAHGVKVRLHSCGDVRPFVPEFINLGIDMLNPIEVKAGMDPLVLKAEYGDKLVFHGGLNAVLYEHPEKMWSEMERVIPVMKVNGGYVIGSDHSVPESVSLAEFGQFVDLAKKLGSYS